MGCCYSDFSGFNFFFIDFSGSFAEVRELFCGFQRFQLLFWRFFRQFRCFWGAVLWILAVPATFLEIFPAVSLFLGAVIVISVVSATFLWIFPAVSLWLGSCFGDFSSFSYFFTAFFRNFSSFWAGWGSCFRSFMDYSYPRPACYQPMAIVHYANLVWGILC